VLFFNSTCSCSVYLTLHLDPLPVSVHVTVHCIVVSRNITHVSHVICSSVGFLLHFAVKYCHLDHVIADTSYFQWVLSDMPSYHCSLIISLLRGTVVEIVNSNFVIIVVIICQPFLVVPLWAHFYDNFQSTPIITNAADVHNLLWVLEWRYTSVQLVM